MWERTLTESTPSKSPVFYQECCCQKSIFGIFRFCKVIRVWPWGRCDGRRCDVAAWAGAGVTGYLARGKLGVCEASGPHTTDSKEIIIANFPVRPSVRPHRACHRPPVRIFAPPVRPSVRPFLGRKAKVFPFARPLEQTQAAEFPPHHHPMPFRRSQMRENRCFRRIARNRFSGFFSVL